MIENLSKYACAKTYRNTCRSRFDKVLAKTRNAFCGTWYLPHSHVHVNNERTVPIIMAECIARARNGRISTSGEKSDVNIVFPDPDFLK